MPPIEITPPSVGRIVHFKPSEHDELAAFREPEMAAVIVRVWSEHCVNLTVFDPNGNPVPRTSVIREGVGNGNAWAWPNRF